MKKHFATIPMQTYWWNMGHKKCDFKGNAWEWMEDRQITVSRIKTKCGTPGYRFRIAVSSCDVILNCFEDSHRAAFEAAKTYLSMMGDKAICHVAERTAKVNWR